MRERPFNAKAWEVRAWQEGRKTQFRRVVKPQPDWKHPVTGCDGIAIGLGGTGPDGGVRCPYGQPGDRLWVRETWMQDHTCPHTRALYRESWGNTPEGQRWRPSIHMPRWASRITLEIVSARVERLNEISAADAKKEGAFLRRCDCSEMSKKPSTPIMAMFSQTWCHIHGEEFKSLWKSINGPGSWDANPWVWVVETKVIT